MKILKRISQFFQDTFGSIMFWIVGDLPNKQHCEYGCHFDDPYGPAVMEGCPIHDPE